MSDLTVGELVELLQQYDEEAEVRLMTQPNWPFESSVAGVCSSEELAKAHGEPDEEHPTLEDRHPSTGVTPKPACVFLVEGKQLSYGDKRAWEVCDR